MLAASGFQENIFVRNSSIISCTGNSSITIVDLSVHRHTTSCTEYAQCNLTVSQNNAIRKGCDQEKSCTISTIIPDSCLYNDHGYVSVSYSCTAIVNSSCTFENGMCGWIIQSSGEKYTWTIQKGETPRSSTGPDRDHTTASENGNYMYTRSTKGSKLNDRSDLLTALTVSSPKQCLTFWYHMYGDDIKTLKVFQLNSKDTVEMWSKSYSQGNKWYYQSLTLKDMGHYRIQFKAIRGDGNEGDIAIDDIIITNTFCKKAIDCNFETGQCGWKTKETTYKWTNWHGSTPSDYTGPAVDHTLGTSNGGYIYLEASKIQNREISHLTSETIYPDGDACFTFWYSMYGRDMDMLNVYFDVENISTIAWSKSGNIWKKWLSASLNISASEPYKIVFEGIIGEDSKGGIALDDIALLPGLCEEAFILDCNFEGGTCNWTTDPETPYIWEILAESTRTAGTGPENDRTTGLADGHYIYLEGTGSDLEEGMASKLKSTTISHVGDTCFSFWYHMYGKHIGTLSVYTESDRIMKRQWSQFGNQGNSWKFANFDISESEPYRIIFEGVRGNGYMSDIAVDDISLYRRSCPASSVDCDFETRSCYWSTYPETPYIWTISSGQTQSTDTGPDNDHTSGSADGHYIYLEGTGSDLKEGMTSKLTSTTISLVGDACFSFWYHMYGKHIGTLNVYTESDNITKRRWSQSSNQGNQWKYAYFDIPESQPYRIIFEGIYGDGVRSDIALDDILLLKHTCSGLFEISQTCHTVDASISLRDCSKYYLHLNQTSLVSDLEFENCSSVYQDVQASIRAQCNNLNNSEICTLYPQEIIMKNARCFQSNKLQVKYKCEVSDTSVKRDNSVTSDSSTGSIVGLVLGGLLLACVVILIVALVRRQTLKSRPRKISRTKHGENDYIGSQDIALPQTAIHVNHIQIDDIYHQLDSRNTSVHVYESSQINNIQQKYTDVSVNKEGFHTPTHAVRRDKTFADQHIDPAVETSLNRTVYKKSATTDSYMVLDPNETDCNRTTFCNTSTDYEFAKTVMDTGNTIADDGQYDLSNDRAYGHSGDNRQIEPKDDIYNHAVDAVYDSAGHKRNNERREDTYDHFIGQKTDDDYDISNTT